MDFEVTSATSTSAVALGQPRHDVRRSLGSHRSFRRTPRSEESDQFAESGVIATYSGSGEVTMLDFVAPARVEVAGLQILGEPLQAVAERLRARGIKVEFDDLGAQIPSLALGLFAPVGVVEGVQLGSD